MRRLSYNFLITLFFCSLTTFFAVSKLDAPLTGIDDANIYFVYARNLANGHGFVYNVGGEKVEGFTSLLWTLIGALAFRFSSHPELILMIINIVIVSGGIAIAMTFLQNDFLKKDESQRAKFLWSGVFLILLLTAPRYIVWNTITLMENGLWSTLLLVTAIFVMKDHVSPKRIALGFIPLSILLILTRPESMLWVTLFMGIIFIRISLDKSTSAGIRVLIPLLVCAGATLGLLTWFRMQYFGYPLPNTYYAKVSPSLTYNMEEGAIYLFQYLISDPIDFLSVTLVFISGFQTLYQIFSKQASMEGSAYLSILAGTGFLMPLITGGDHFGSFRFYQNIYPITVLSLFYVFDRVIRKAFRPKLKSFPPWATMVSKIVVALIAGVGLFISQARSWNHLKAEIVTEFQVAAYERKNGALIQQLFSPLPKLPSIGVIAAGGIKYYYEGDIIDLMGLNNTIMAHNGGKRTGYKNHAAFEINTFFELEPDIVWPKEVDVRTWQYSDAQIMRGWENQEGLKGLFNNTEFQTLYTFAKVSPGKGRENKYALVAWFKEDLLKQLESNPDFRVEEYTHSSSPTMGS